MNLDNPIDKGNASSDKGGASGSLFFKWFLTSIVFVGLFAAGVGVSYFVFRKNFHPAPEEAPQSPQSPQAPSATAPVGEYIYLKIYYPLDGRLQMEERRATKTDSSLVTARAVVEEFLKGPAGVAELYAPQGAELLGIYPGTDGILYVDFSEAFRRNFEGDALAEFLLLRGLYESLLTNVYGISDVRVLIEGQEAETVGGHVSLAGPLSEAVSQSMEGQD